MAITEVKYVEDNRLSRLQEKVNAFIADGWQPNGQMVAYNNYGTQTFVREMVQVAPASGGGASTIGDIDGLQAALDAKAPLVAGKIPAANLPVATADAAGVVKQGSGCTVAGDGTLSVP